MIVSTKRLEKAGFTKMERKNTATRTLGDLAVDGLLRGLAAGFMMMIVLLVAALLDGATPMTALSRFGFAAGDNALSGLLSHLAATVVLGAAWGVLYGAALHRLSLPAWLLGVACGLILYVGAATFVIGASGLADFAPWQLLLAHGVFGLTLGVLSGRQTQMT
jgi:hypothetical protein